MAVEHVGDRMRARRRRLGMTLEEVGAAVNLSGGAIQTYESGRTEPPVSLLPLLARILSCSVDYLVGTDDPDEVVAVVASYDNGLTEILDGEIAERVKHLIREHRQQERIHGHRPA